MFSRKKEEIIKIKDIEAKRQVYILGITRTINMKGFSSSFLYLSKVGDKLRYYFNTTSNL